MKNPDRELNNIKIKGYITVAIIIAIICLNITLTVFCGIGWSNNDFETPIGKSNLAFNILTLFFILVSIGSNLFVQTDVQNNSPLWPALFLFLYIICLIGLFITSCFDVADNTSSNEWDKENISLLSISSILVGLPICLFFLYLF